MNYNHLTTKERVCNRGIFKFYLGVNEIAKRQGRSKSTISRELKRKSVNGKYLAISSENQYEERRAKCHKPLKLSNTLKDLKHKENVKSLKKLEEDSTSEDQLKIDQKKRAKKSSSGSLTLLFQAVKRIKHALQHSTLRKYYIII